MENFERLMVAVEDLLSDAEMVDGEFWGMLVGIKQLDAVRDALKQAREDS